MSVLRCTVALSAVLLSAGCPRGGHASAHPAAKPFFDLRSTEPNYAGPGREMPDPVDAKEVLIGYFGPAVASHPQAGDMWCAACLAIEQANEAGRYRGLPFRLAQAWSDNPWGSGVKELTRLVFEEKIWAIIGGADGPTTHLAEQVAVKAQVPLLNPVSTDKTVNLINVPWIFSCTPQDPIQARALAEGLSSRLGRRPFVLASAVDHDSHLFTVELQKALAAHQLQCASHYQFNPTDTDSGSLVDKIGVSRTDAVVLLAGAVPSARLVRALREGGYTGMIFGGPWMAHRPFVVEAGSAAEGVVFPCSTAPSVRWKAFEERFSRRFGSSPDSLAAHTYDAITMLVAAIRRAGLNRARIRDAIRELSPWEGVSGRIAWDPPGSNPRPVSLCTIVGRQVVPLAQGQVTSR